MAALIVAESAIFTIFVVAYLFYVGKSSTGPTPKEVLETPIFYTICLLSSSITIHLAGRFLERGRRWPSSSRGCSQSCWAGSSIWHCLGMASVDLSARVDHFTLTCSERPIIRWSGCCHSPCRRPVDAYDRPDFRSARPRRSRAIRTPQRDFHVLAFRGRGRGSGVQRRVRDRPLRRKNGSPSCRKHRTNLAAAERDRGAFFHSVALVLALGFTLMFTGMLTSVSVSLLGAVLTVAGCAGWFGEVFPREHEVVVQVIPERIPPATQRRVVERVPVAADHLRVWLPRTAHIRSRRLSKEQISPAASRWRCSPAPMGR